jgi:hypothetical protein
MRARGGAMNIREKVWPAGTPDVNTQGPAASHAAWLSVASSFFAVSTAAQEATAAAELPLRARQVEGADADSR